MIISRAPVRMSLGGGGTDLPSYYEKYEGFLIAASINKYIYLCINKRFDDSIRLSYSKTEVVRNISAIKHRIFRAAFEYMDIRWGVEAVSIADVPSNCGLGSSSVFTVSLLNALHQYKREYVPLEQLAEEACKIEMEILGEPIGKQDQYMAAFGGLTCLHFAKDGKVTVEPLKMPETAMDQLVNNTHLFYTKIQRSASDILAGQAESVKKDESRAVEAMHRIKDIGLRTKAAFEAGKVDTFGDLLHEHWTNKKKLSNKISDPFIDECYETALKSGATGGKIMGAGGGGFFLFYCPGDAAPLIQALENKGLARMPFQIDSEGAKIVANIRNL